jgi:hypothetical protein
VPRKRAKRGAAPPIEVTAQERRHLIDDIAYFHAEHFRTVEKNGCREADRHEAADEVGTLLQRCRKS